VNARAPKAGTARLEGHAGRGTYRDELKKKRTRDEAAPLHMRPPQNPEAPRENLPCRALCPARETQRLSGHRPNRKLELGHRPPFANALCET